MISTKPLIKSRHIAVQKGLSTLISVRYLHGKGGNDGNEPPSVGRGRRKRSLKWSDRFFDINTWSNDMDPHLMKSAGISPVKNNSWKKSELNDSNAQKLRFIDAAKQEMDPKQAERLYREVYQQFIMPNGNPNSPGNGSKKNFKESFSNQPVTLDTAVTLQEYVTSLDTMLKHTNPRLISDHLDKFIIGQSLAKQSMSCAVYNHYSRVYHNLCQRKEAMENFPSKPSRGLDKSNILLLGPSGSGKTLIAKRIAEVLKVPFSMNDATTFTQAGYVGEDVEQCVSRLLAAAQGNVKKAEIGIIFIDEIDKISKRTDASSQSGSRDVGGEGVQQALLKMLEGTTVYAPEKPNKKGDNLAIDTTNILFILSGAFVGIDRIVKDRKVGDNSIGFGAKVSSKQQEVTNPFREVAELDLIRFGLIPEFVGRVPLIVPVEKLSEDELVRILHEPKNSLVEQYTKLFQTWNIHLEFTNDALHSIAKRVLDRHTGARGLKFAMEEVLKEPMYIAPGSNIGKITIDGSLTPTYAHFDEAESVYQMGEGENGDDVKLDQKNNDIPPTLLPQFERNHRPIVPLH